MVHGDCSSRGCYSMTDEQISEIYALGRDSFFGGQKSFQVQAYPFRMTPKNLAKHRNNPHMAFWKMLKRGNDHFEVTHLEPKVDVCEKRYVFDAQAPGNPHRPLSFRATEKCPAFEVDAETAAAVEQKQHQDEIQLAELVRRGSPTAPVKTHADGGMHPVFVDAVKRNQVGVAPGGGFSLAAQAPGTIPVHVRPPRIPELSDSPIVTGSAIEVAGQERHAPAAAAPVRTASAEPKGTTQSGNLFGSLFSFSADTNEPKRSGATKKEDSTLDRMARFIGLRGTDPETTESIPAPKSKPRATAAATPNAVRPKPAAADPPKPAETPRVIQVAAPAPAPAPAIAAAPAPAVQPASSGLNGAAPVVPTGTFDSRWSAFR
jgi:hypothetical protein